MLPTAAWTRAIISESSQKNMVLLLNEVISVFELSG